MRLNRGGALGKVLHFEGSMALLRRCRPQRKTCLWRRFERSVAQRLAAQWLGVCVCRPFGVSSLSQHSTAVKATWFSLGASM